jgi:hypothetical protein
MALVAEYRLDCGDLPLVDVAAAVPEVTLHVDVGQPNQGGPPPFFVRAIGEAVTDLESAFDESPFVARYARISRAATGSRYQILPSTSMVEQLADVVDDPDRLESLSANDSFVERITVTPDGWLQKRWFADRSAFDEYRHFWRENEVPFSLRRLSASDFDSSPNRALTDRQREALQTAYEMGYFDIPRSTSLEEVGRELGISAAALSERLRRAHATVVEEVVGTDRVRRRPTDPE